MTNRLRCLRMSLCLVASLVAGCSYFGGEDEADAGNPALVVDPARLVAQITNVELGRTANGYALSVFGLSNTAGWGRPELRLRDIEPDAEGFLSFDFVAVPPAEPTLSPMAQLPEARRVRADRLLSEAFLAGLAGLRIWTETGATEVTFN